MVAVKEVLTSSAHRVPRVAEPRRKGEVFAWIMMALIWALSIVSFYLLWQKTNL
jgi:hypothetical protein